MNLSLIILIILGGTFFLAQLTKKINLPAIFSALLVGVVFSVFRLWPVLIDSSTINYLSELGMYFLLFLIGLEVNLKKVHQNSVFIIRSAFLIIGLEAILGAVLIHQLFSLSWVIAFLVGISFATVGEAVLIPILENFRMINTKLGQMIIGIGTIDDLIEIISLIFLGWIIGSTGSKEPIVSFAVLLLMLGGFLFFLKSKKIKDFFTKKDLNYFSLSLIVFFLFVGLGKIADLSVLGALMSGLSLNILFLNNQKGLKKITQFIKSLTFDFLGPIFFFIIGSHFDLKVFLNKPFYLFLVILVIVFAKVIGSVLFTYNQLGFKGSILLATGLLIKFSTSIIIVKILYSLGIIPVDLYSILIAVSIIFVVLVPIIFTVLSVRWKKVIV